MVLVASSGDIIMLAQRLVTQSLRAFFLGLVCSRNISLLLSTVPDVNDPKIGRT